MSLPAQEIAAASQKLHTYQDYCRLPEGAPYQLIGGELVLTPAPGTYHQVVSMKLELQRAKFVLDHDLGLVLDTRIDVHLGETETYQPDLVFIAGERMHISRASGFLCKAYFSFGRVDAAFYAAVDPAEASETQLHNCSPGVVTGQEPRNGSRNAQGQAPHGPTPEMQHQPHLGHAQR